MNSTFNLTPTLQSIFIQPHNSFLRRVLPVLLGVMVLAIASQISIPLTPVPLTFQSATVILLGMALGPRFGTYIILSYLTAGICGLPVFADLSAGPHVLVSPTGGYLVGFVPAAFISGSLAQLGFAKSIIRSFIAACAGTAFIFAFGMLQLSTFIGWDAAITAGLLPFMVSEPIKLLAVAIMVPRLWKQHD